MKNLLLICIVFILVSCAGNSLAQNYPFPAKKIKPGAIQSTSINSSTYKRIITKHQKQIEEVKNERLQDLEKIKQGRALEVIYDIVSRNNRRMRK